jgi:hypothetical protein
VFEIMSELCLKCKTFFAGLLLNVITERWFTMRPEKWAFMAENQAESAQ